MTAPQPTCEVVVRPEVTILRPVGRFGLEANAIIDRAVNQAIAGRPRRVVVDARGLEFIASMALGQLVMLARKVGAGGGSMQVQAAAPEIRDLLARTRLGELLHLADALDPDCG